MYTWHVQLADFRWDEIEQRGAIDANQAVEEFRSFPFKEQIMKAVGMPEPTMPTISFACPSQLTVLSIWSGDPEKYEVYLERPGRKVTVETTDTKRIEQTIRRFFSGERESLYLDLASYSGAVTVRSIIDRLKDLFA